VRVLVFESNLLWSQRFRHALFMLGHSAEIHTSMPGEIPLDAGAAIVNLGDAQFDLQMLIPQLRDMGIPTIGHAGHKEKPLHEFGKDIGCDVLATNSEMTHKLAQVLERAQQARQ
jgi:hypothetical protein